MDNSTSPWWKSSVIYQVSVGSFRDSNSDGFGDLRGLLESLDYINDGTPRSLGADAIWLNPVMKTPFVDFGYDVSDYYSIDPRFGTMADFDELLAECHRRGMKLIMDMVLNHTSQDHPWFAESRSSRDNPKRDWYIWRDGRAPGKPPNKWKAVVEGSAWVLDEPSMQWYYHAFLPEQPDINWRNTEARQAMLDAFKFWLDKGVDGYRLDLINYLYEDEQLRDNPHKLGVRMYEWQKHVYDRSLPESVAATKLLRRITDSYSERMMMGEVYTDTPEEAAKYAGDGENALHLSFYLDFAMTSWSAEKFRASVDHLEHLLPEKAWPCYYFSNHDLVRHITRFARGGDAVARAKVAAAMILTLRGTPILYYGEEIGMPNSRIKRSDMVDPVGLKWWPIPVGRDGSRTPMQWSASGNAGFSSARPWLPVDPSYVTVNVERQEHEPRSLLSWYRSLIHARRETPALLAGNYRPLDGMPGGVFAYTRELEESCAAVFLNFVSRPQSVKVPSRPGGGSWKVLLSTHGPGGDELEPGKLRLQPDQALICA